MILTSTILLLTLVGFAEPHPFNLPGPNQANNFNQALLLSQNNIQPPPQSLFYSNQDLNPMSNNAQRFFQPQQQQQFQHSRFNQFQQRPLIGNRGAQQYHQQQLQQFFRPEINPAQAPQTNRQTAHIQQNSLTKSTPTATTSSNDFLSSLQIIDTHGRPRELKEFGLGGSGSQLHEPELERQLKSIFEVINRDLENAAFLPLDMGHNGNHQVANIFQQQSHSPHQRQQGEQIIQQQQLPVDIPKNHVQQSIKQQTQATQRPQLGNSFQYLRPQRANKVIEQQAIRSPAQALREGKMIEKVVNEEQRPIEQQDYGFEKSPNKGKSEEPRQPIIKPEIPKIPTQNFVPDYPTKGRPQQTFNQVPIRQEQEPIVQLNEQQPIKSPPTSAPIAQRPAQIEQTQQGFDDEPTALKNVEHDHSSSKGNGWRSPVDVRKNVEPVKTNQVVEEFQQQRLIDPIKKEHETIRQEQEHFRQEQSPIRDQYEQVHQSDGQIGQQNFDKAAPEIVQRPISPPVASFEPIQQQQHIVSDNEPEPLRTGSYESSSAKGQGGRKLKNDQKFETTKQTIENQKSEVSQFKQEFDEEITPTVKPEGQNSLGWIPMVQSPVSIGQQKTLSSVTHSDLSKQKPLRPQYSSSKSRQYNEKVINYDTVQPISQVQQFPQFNVRTQQKQVTQVRDQQEVQQQVTDAAPQKQLRPQKTRSGRKQPSQQSQPQIKATKQTLETRRPEEEFNQQQLRQEPQFNQEAQRQLAEDKPAQLVQQEQELDNPTPILPIQTIQQQQQIDEPAPLQQIQQQQTPLIEQQKEVQQQQDEEQVVSQEKPIKTTEQQRVEDPVQQTKQADEEPTQVQDNQEDRSSQTTQLIQTSNQEAQQQSSQQKLQEEEPTQQDVRTQNVGRQQDDESSPNQQQQRINDSQQSEEEQGSIQQQTQSQSVDDLTQPQPQQQEEAPTTTIRPPQQKIKGRKGRPSLKQTAKSETVTQQQSFGTNKQQNEDQQTQQKVESPAQRARNQNIETKVETVETTERPRQQDDEAFITTVATTTTTTTDRPERQNTVPNDTQKEDDGGRFPAQRVTTQQVNIDDNQEQTQPDEQQQTRQQDEETAATTTTTTTVAPRLNSKSRFRLNKARQQQISGIQSSFSNKQNNGRYNSNEGYLSAHQLLNTFNPLQFEPERISSLVRNSQNPSQNNNVNSSPAGESY